MLFWPWRGDAERPAPMAHSGWKRIRVDSDLADAERDDSDVSLAGDRPAPAPASVPDPDRDPDASSCIASTSAGTSHEGPHASTVAGSDRGAAMGVSASAVEAWVQPAAVSGAGTEADVQAAATCSMLALPYEVLVTILQHCSYSEVAESFRLVCRRFAEVCAIVLNAGLHRVGQSLTAALDALEIAMENATTDNEMSVAARAFCALEFARMQWRLIEATVWRHGAEAFGQTSAGGARACCFGGRLLDRLHNICALSRDDPVGLAWSFHYGSAFRTTSARRRLAHDTKRFLNVYEKYAERRINSGPRVCGAKLVDLLMSLEDEKCIQVDQRATCIDLDTGLFHLRATFVLPRAWFTCLSVPSPDAERSARERHRYMFLRMRRLVTACNESTLERTHYEREMLMRMHTPWRTSVVLPLASKYAAFGHYADEFFYYGALNERAFDDRFRSDPLLEILGPNIAEGVSPVPAMEVRVHVRMACPPSLAPLAALRRLRFEDFDSVATLGTAAVRTQGPFALEMDFHCAASQENRLPCRFTWRVSDDDADADGNWLPIPPAPSAPPPPPHRSPFDYFNPPFDSGRSSSPPPPPSPSTPGPSHLNLPTTIVVS